eukprot:1271096-Amphidinium_carterae.1
MNYVMTEKGGVQVWACRDMKIQHECPNPCVLGSILLCAFLARELYSWGSKMAGEVVHFIGSPLDQYPEAETAPS